MLERGVVMRGFLALFVIAAALSTAYVMFSDTDGTSGNFLEDDHQGSTSYAYGPIFENPDGYRAQLLADRWIREIRVTGGGTFGSEITRQVRIGIDGTGPIPTREVTLQTQPAVRLFNGPSRKRAQDVLHGVQRILEEEGGLLEGLSLTESRGGMEAATIASIVEQRLAEGVSNASDRALLARLIREAAMEDAAGAQAWYDDRYQQVVLGPEISRGLLTWVRTPGKAALAQNLFTAFVLRHELEHAITPASDRDYARLQWLEEGTAETLARWPGVAARTAKELGMPYPTRFERIQYATKRGGYPEWTDTLRVLLGAAGVDWKDPTEVDEAAELLQSEDVSRVPALLAARIAERDRLSARERVRIEREIRSLDGSTAAARRLVASL